MTKMVQRIDSHYVGEDCVQVMIPYRDKISILSNDEMIFHYKNGSYIYINKYLDDERRKQFPYSNIPTHFARVRMKKYAYTNQLLDFEKPYIVVSDSEVIEKYAIKDSNQALVISSALTTYNSQTLHLTHEELMGFVGQNKEQNNVSDEKIYYMGLDGGVFMDLFPIKEKVYNYIRGELSRTISYFEEFPTYGADRSWVMNLLKQEIKNIDFSRGEFNVKYLNSLLIVRINNKEIKMQLIDVTFINDNDYRVDVKDVPVTKYTLEQLKYVSKIVDCREPRIPLKLNPGVSKESVVEAKKMVRTLKTIK